MVDSQKSHGKKTELTKQNKTRPSNMPSGNFEDVMLAGKGLPSEPGSSNEAVKIII